ncbi:molybdate ABC transporter substrate-binding protein [Desulfobacula toluolica]|uniref:ModA2: molybdenum ABC transporter, periplasmic molybdate-binding protein n=1 Tax=Desulfobacula toluolica (strain DSM 7467 / Tol2) TaxID=651182 RepID=K0NLA2_DESTT|nr:molybdate ABC transporter substrate-binding protein [Desulfobacula toluolica]CCK79477.1 ModA2: molybdenum ABC transporter, periplasmic molybdate-binding protein [Desulfobacula toluolica Tol2]
MRKLIFIFVILLVFAGNSYAADLVVFSGAGLIKPMEEMRKNFEKQNNIQVDIHYGSSGEIFGMLAAGQPCDVLIPGAAKYTDDALKNGWVIKETIHNLVLHVPVIAVPKGNPADIRGFEDLARPGIKVAIGDPKAPAIGKVAKKMLTKAGLWEKVQPNIEVYAPTVNQLLIYVALKQVDAAVIWGDLTSWAEGKGKLEVIPIEAKYNMIKTIPTAVCSKTANMEKAMAFNAYVASKQGGRIWQNWGFKPCEE